MQTEPQPSTDLLPVTVAGKRPKSHISLPQAALFLILFAMLVVGGGSSYVPIFRMASQLLGIIVLAIVAMTVQPTSIFRADPAQALFGFAIMLLFAVHLYPLYPETWTTMPGRGLFAAGDMLIFGLPQNRPLSLDPEETVAAALFFIPALAAWLLVRSGPAGTRLWLLAWFCFLLISLTLSLVQSLSHAGEFRFYDNSHNSVPVGLFANRNHQAAAMACGIPFAAAWHRLGKQNGSLASPWVFPLSALALTIGTLLTASRAGAVLLLPTLGSSVAIAYAQTSGSTPDSRQRWLKGFGIALAIIAGLVVMIRATNAGGRLAAVFSRGLFGDDSRWRFWPAAWNGIETYWPWGSGLGTFPRAFEVREPGTVLSPLYLNHAHNDWLELAFDSGLPGVLLAAAFLLWLAWRLRAVILAGLDKAPLAAAAGLVTIILMLHSLCDYPLRTETIIACFAASLGMLAPPNFVIAKPARANPDHTPQAPQAESRWLKYCRAAVIGVIALGLCGISIETGIRNNYLAARQVSNLPESWPGARVDAQRALDLAQAKGPFGRIATFAVRAAIRSPLVEPAFTAAAISSRDQGQADALLLHAFSLSRHNPVLLVALFDRARAANDPQHELAAAIAIYQTQTGNPRIDAAFASDLNRPQVLDLAISSFRADPKARQRFLAAAASAPVDREGLIRLIGALRAGQNPIQRNEIAPLISELATGPHRDPLAGWRVFSLFTSKRDPFAWPSSEALQQPLPFDWTLSGNAQMTEVAGMPRLTFADANDPTLALATRRMPIGAGNYRVSIPADAPGARVRIDCNGKSWQLGDADRLALTEDCIQAELAIFPGRPSGWIGNFTFAKLAN
jgi:O-antigen ligase